MRIISKLLPASKLKLVISGIGVLALVAFLSLILFEAAKAEVVLTDNGEKQTVKTHANTVKELLDEVGIVVGEHDGLSHSADSTIENGMQIDYRTAMQVIVTIDGVEHEYYTISDTIEEFLADNNLSVSKYDDVSHELTEEIVDGLQFDVTKGFQVTVNDGGTKEKYWTTGGTIAQLLDKYEITYSKDSDDRIKPSIDENIKKDTVITIVRVEKSTDEVTSTVAFDTEKREDSTLEKGKKKVISEGQEGTVVKTYEVTKENGKEVSRELVSEKVTEAGANRIVAIGTKEPVQNLVTLSSTKPKSNSTPTPTKSNTSSAKEFYVTASAFTANCSGCSGVTRTGINLKADPNMKVIAVDPSVIPLGSRVWVEGYGEAIAGDTGGHIVGNRIDVHVPSKDDAYRWGVRKVKIKIIN